MRLAFAFALIASTSCSADPTQMVTPPVDLRMLFHSGCNSGDQDGDETGVDCGGTCGPCDTGGGCKGARDCISGICVNRTCAAPACDDMTRNGNESDVDCGGSCPVRCAEGKKCGDGPDCQSFTCVNGICGKSGCGNARQDGMESDVDCGGPVCDPCGTGQGCGDGIDCLSGRCVNQKCAAVPDMGGGVGNCSPVNFLSFDRANPFELMGSVGGTTIPEIRATNTSNQPLMVSNAVLVTPDNPAAFRMASFYYPQGNTAQWPVTIPPGSFLTMSVRFTPLARGVTYTGSINLDTGRGAASICLKGTGQ